MPNVKGNFFIAQNEDQRAPKKLISLANKLLKKMGYNYQLKRGMDPMTDMNSVEQRINFYHLLTSVIENNTPGHVVELGSFNGQCAVLFQQILQFHHSDKQLHLFDSFEHKFTLSGDVETALLNNFSSKGLTPPVIHKGLFQDTLESGLPEEVAFAHIDCGFGGDKFQHRDVVLFCLEKLYPKMADGGICVLMDYHDYSQNDPGGDYNPGVKLACDAFFKDKKEAIICLYGNESSQAYFKKGRAGN